MTIDRRLFALGGALAAGLMLAGCGGPGGRTAHFTFKMTARARLKGDDYEGFAVSDMRARYTSNTLSGFLMGRTLKMESTIVNFGAPQFAARANSAPPIPLFSA